MLGTNIKIKFKYLVERENEQQWNDFCVSSLRIEKCLCGCLQNEMRREPGLGQSGGKKEKS